MSETDKKRIIEEHLPSLQTILEEYKAQGRALTKAEAKAVREQLREAMAAGHVDAMENILGEDALDKVRGGGLVGTPTMTPEVEEEAAETQSFSCQIRPN